MSLATRTTAPSPSSAARPVSAEGDFRPPSGRTRSALIVRVLCHLAAELPLVIVAVIELAGGWRPLFDNANTAWRAYLVFSSDSPLVGHHIAGPFLAYGLGPLQYWLLAIPVRIDPLHAVLWGSVVLAVVGVALAIEAAWSTARWLGGCAVAAGILVLYATQPEVLVNPAWNASLGAIWFLTTLATGWAVASGRLRWWPVTVLAATLAAQTQEFVAIACIVLCLITPALGVLTVRRARAALRWGWAIVGLVVAFLLWIVPVVQQLTGHPGNFTLLWRALHRHAATLGVEHALGAISAMTRLYPQWTNPLPTHSQLGGFFYAATIFSGAIWWGVTVLIVLAVIAAVAWWRGRTALAALATVATVTSLITVATIASFPASQILQFDYLEAFLALIGMAAWATLIWAVAELARAVVSIMAHRVTFVPETLKRLGTIVFPLAGSALVLSMLGLALAADLPPQSTAATASDPTAVRQANLGTDLVVRAHPPKAFTLLVNASDSDTALSLRLGIGYQLRLRGLEPRLGSAAIYVGPSARSRPGMPAYSVHLGSVTSGHRSQREWVTVSSSGPNPGH